MVQHRQLPLQLRHEALALRVRVRVKTAPLAVKTRSPCPGSGQGGICMVCLVLGNTAHAYSIPPPMYGMFGAWDHGPWSYECAHVQGWDYSPWGLVRATQIYVYG